MLCVDADTEVSRMHVRKSSKSTHQVRIASMRESVSNFQMFSGLDGTLVVKTQETGVLLCASASSNNWPENLS